MSHRNRWLLMIFFLLFTVPGKGASAGFFDWDESPCGAEDMTLLEAYRTGELGPLVPAAGPPSSDHSRSLNIFRARFHGLVPAEDLNAYLTAKLQDMLVKGLNTNTPPPIKVVDDNLSPLPGQPQGDGLSDT